MGMNTRASFEYRKSPIWMIPNFLMRYYRGELMKIAVKRKIGTEMVVSQIEILKRVLQHEFISRDSWREFQIPVFDGAFMDELPKHKWDDNHWWMIGDADLEEIFDQSELEWNIETWTEQFRWTYAARVHSRIGRHVVKHERGITIVEQRPSRDDDHWLHRTDSNGI